MVGVRVSDDLRIAVVGSPAYLAARGRPEHPHDLAAHDCISYRRRTLGAIGRWEFTENGKDFEVAVKGRLLLDDGDLLARAALDGLGLASVMESSVREHLANERLVRLLESSCVPFPGFCLYYPSRTHVAPELQTRVAALKHPPGKAGGRRSASTG